MAHLEDTLDGAVHHSMTDGNGGGGGDFSGEILGGDWSGESRGCLDGTRPLDTLGQAGGQAGRRAGRQARRHASRQAARGAGR